MHENTRGAVKDWWDGRHQSQPKAEYSTEEKQARARLRASINRHVQAGNVNGLADDAVQARAKGWVDLAGDAEQEQRTIIDTLRELDEANGGAA